MATRRAQPPGFPQPVSPLRNDPSKNVGQWTTFPDQLPGARFNGFMNRDNESLLRGSFVVGQNIQFSGDFQPAIRQGYELLGTEQADANEVLRAWVFETRAGDVFELKQDAAGKVWFWLRGTSTDWKTLLTGLTADLACDFANIGKAANATTHVYFNNGTDSFYRFSGAYATVASVTANTITKSGSSTWTAEGFYSTGTRSVRIEGADYTYTGGEGTTTLTGVSPDPSAAGVVAGNLAVQSPQVVSGLSSHLSNVLMAHDGRLHARLGTKKSIWEYSKLDDPEDFTTGSVDGDGGQKEVEFGGPITAFGKINKTAVAFKKRLIKILSFNQFGSRLDSPFYQTLTSSDDRSTTLGAINNKSVCSTPFGLVFITPDKRLVLLTGVTANNEPQYIVLSDPIQPIFDNGDFANAAVICAENILWVSFKETVSSDSNDTVMRADLTRQTLMPDGKTIPCMWDAPTVGWNVNDWTVVYNSSTGKYDVHFHSSLSSNSYRIIADPTDNTSSMTAIARSWAENFGMPSMQKRIDWLYIEVKMSVNTELTGTLLYDENGVTQQYEFTLDGDSADNRFTNTEYNPFGASAFGTQKFGSNSAVDDVDLYRFYIHLNRIPPFYNISLQLSSDADGQIWQLVRFGYRIAEVLKEPDNFKLVR